MAERVSLTQMKWGNMSLKPIVAITFLLCHYNFSFLHAAIPIGYMGKPFTGDSLRGKPQKIPGSILGVYFDEGGEGVGFHEPDGAKVWGGETIRKDPKDRSVEMQYFTTHDFREDGTVDVGYCHLSWMEPPKPDDWEWYQFTVHVDTAGSYAVDFHWAVAQLPNITSITFNDMKPDSQVNVPLSIRPKNDHEIYHDWKWSNKLSTVSLDTGLYVLKLQFIKGNWNFDALRFTLAGSASLAQKHNLINQGSLSAVQNGKDLNISYSSAKLGVVNFKLIDILGVTVFNRVENQGSLDRNTVSFPLENLVNGFYQLQMEQSGSVMTQKIFIHR